MYLKRGYFSSKQWGEAKFVCDLCGHRSAKRCQKESKILFILDTKWRVVKCRKCRLKSLYPIPTDNELKEIYSSYASLGDRLKVEKSRIEIYKEKLNKLSKLISGIHILDIGAGIGTFVFLAKQSGFDAYGVEYNRKQCEMAENIWGVKLINGLFEDVRKEFGDNSFDIINLHHVLEHVRSPNTLLKQVYDILAANGILLIEVPYQFGSFKTEIKTFLGKYDKPNNSLHHLYFFTPRILKKLLKINGFNIIEINQFRKRSKKLNILERVPKDIYRKLINFIGFGGAIIEIYSRRQ